MAKKFQDIVNAPQMAMRDATKKLWKYKARGKNKNWKNAGVKTVAIPSSIVSFLLWLSTKVALDNKALRALEKTLAGMKVGKNKEGKDKKLSAFAKKYPNFSAHMIYYMMIAMTWGGVKLAKSDPIDTIKQKIESVFGDDDTISEDNFDDLVIDPNASDEQWKKQLDAIHPYVIAHVFLHEGFIRKAYYDNGSGGTLTIGAGFTINDASHRNCAHRVLGRWLGNGSTVTVAEARMLTDAWLREMVYPRMKKAFKKPMDARTFVSLSIAAYNMGESTFIGNNRGKKVREAVNGGKSKEEIAKLLVQTYGGTIRTIWPGLANKYTICAMYMLGEISDQDILNSISEAPYSLADVLENDPVYKQKFNPKNMKSGRLVIYGKNGKPNGYVHLDNVDEMLQVQQDRITKGTRQRKIREYLSENEVNTIMKGKLFKSGVVDFQTEVEKSKTVTLTESEKLNEEGEHLFFENDFKGAIKKFKAAIEKDEKNYIAYSNLSIAYYRDNDFQSGLAVVQNLIKSGVFRNAPDDIKSYTYYNAALCREKLGDLATNKQEKIEHYKKALANYELASKKGSASAESRKGKVQKKLNELSANKARAFNSGKSKIKQKSENRFLADLIKHNKKSNA